MEQDRKAMIVKGCRHIKLDGHNFVVDQTKTPKLIADKIEHEQQQKQQ
jgi:hypothetical protein